MTPLERYLAELARGELQTDAAQRRAVEYTQQLYDKLLEESEARAGFLRRV